MPMKVCMKSFNSSLVDVGEADARVGSLATVGTEDLQISELETLATLGILSVEEVRGSV